MNYLLVTSYNNQAFDDLLTIQLKPSQGAHISTDTKENITAIYNNHELVGMNIFSVSQWLDGLSDGSVTLSAEQVDTLNKKIKEYGFDFELEADTENKFVVGYVQECRPHDDSDHLHVTQTLVGNDEVLQIVCGAKNIAAGQKVVVAKPGAIMPGGLVIWPGELRGVESNGMICSAKELDLPKEQHGEGILVLPEDAVVGEAFSFALD